ncbi:MAG: hypothetical protein C4K47_05915 [Candidatus Thorarchaeota archaeon]|nr:MAG: hypothetical protein C4K47_05915 [Candidatus Thorarchaeota archaeon]
MSTQAGEISMSERKNVIIDLEESEKNRFGELSEIESAEATGVMTVKNVSAQARIWNVRVNLGDSRSGTTIKDSTLSAGEVEAGGEWSTKYGITIDGPILTLTETYDTCSSITAESPHWAYVHGKENPVRITLHLKNETDGQIDNIIVNKTIPPELTKVKVDSAKSGMAKFDEGTRQVVWKDFVIYPKEESTLTLSGLAHVDDVSEKNAGEVVISYKSQGQQRSCLDPDMTALTEFLSGIETAETEPNHWECTLECSNETDLIVRLDKAVVFLTPEGGGEKKKMVEVAPRVEMKPGETWRSSFEVDSKAPPKCTPDVVYTPVRVVKRRVLGTATKVPQILPVCQITYAKSFDPSEVSSLDKTPVEVTIDIKNSGSARLDQIEVEDSLPDDVMPPKKEHVTVSVAGKEYTGTYGVTITPDDQNPETPHKVRIKISGMRDSMGELKPGDSLKVSYAIMAWRNRPEKEYPSPIHCWAYTHPAGFAAEAVSTPFAHKLGVVYRKRRIAAKKAISKGSKAGEYVITLVVENKGEVTVENVKLVDWIPSGFTYVSTDPREDEPKRNPAKDGTDMVWTWARMNPSDKKSLRIVVKGEGEYQRREPEVASD